MNKTTSEVSANVGENSLQCSVINFCGNSETSELTTCQQAGDMELTFIARRSSINLIFCTRKNREYPPATLSSPPKKSLYNVAA